MGIGSNIPEGIAYLCTTVLPAKVNYSFAFISKFPILNTSTGANRFKVLPKGQ